MRYLALGLLVLMCSLTTSPSINTTIYSSINSARADGFEPEKLPIREMLQTIQNVEREQDGESPSPSKSRAARVALSAHAKDKVSVEWDPEASPTAMRSWMMFHLTDETWRNIRENKNQRGQPLL